MPTVFSTSRTRWYVVCIILSLGAFGGGGVLADDAGSPKAQMDEAEVREYFKTQNESLGSIPEDIPYGLAGIKSSDERVRRSAAKALKGAWRAPSNLQLEAINALVDRLSSKDETIEIKHVCLLSLLRVDSAELKKHVPVFKALVDSQAAGNEDEKFVRDDGERRCAAAIFMLRWGDLTETLKVFERVRENPSGAYAVSGAFISYAGETYAAETSGFQDLTASERAAIRNLLMSMIDHPLPKVREHVLAAFEMILRPGKPELPDQRQTNLEIKTALEARLPNEDDANLHRAIIYILDWFTPSAPPGFGGPLPLPDSPKAPEK
jgi:hypothetical protein